MVFIAGRGVGAPGTHIKSRRWRLDIVVPRSTSGRNTENAKLPQTGATPQLIET